MRSIELIADIDAPTSWVDNTSLLLNTVTGVNILNLMLLYTSASLFTHLKYDWERDPIRVIYCCAAVVITPVTEPVQSISPPIARPVKIPTWVIAVCVAPVTVAAEPDALPVKLPTKTVELIDVAPVTTLVLMLYLYLYY